MDLNGGLKTAKHGIHWNTFEASKGIRIKRKQHVSNSPRCRKDTTVCAKHLSIKLKKTSFGPA
jgi:hypothetical protein